MSHNNNLHKFATICKNVVWDDSMLKWCPGQQFAKQVVQNDNSQKGLLAIAKLKPLSLFISLLLMLKKALDNVKIEKWKVKVVSALQ